MIQLVYLPNIQTCDLGRSGKNLLDDPSLATATIISLFTRRQANKDDKLPDSNNSDRMGWWADSYADVPGRLMGSRLWLLNRSKATADVPPTAANFAVEALQWMVEDGVASLVRCIADWQPMSLGSSTPLLAIQPFIYRPANPTPYSAIWLANLALL